MLFDVKNSTIILYIVIGYYYFILYIFFYILELRKYTPLPHPSNMNVHI